MLRPIEWTDDIAAAVAQCVTTTVFPDGTFDFQAHNAAGRLLIDALAHCGVAKEAAKQRPSASNLRAYRRAQGRLQNALKAARRMGGDRGR